MECRQSFLLCFDWFSYIKSSSFDVENIELPSRGSVASYSSCILWLYSLAFLFTSILESVSSFFYKVCNRTYYARLGTTYRLSLVRPRLTGTTQMLPWHCWFNFTALGGHHGDRVLVRLIQIYSVF